MKKAQLKNITVVGGGSAGWMTAIYLNKLFSDARQSVTIRVIESKDVAVIGVGEATVTSIRQFFAQMELDEYELINATNATLKLGIMFRNWMKPVADKTHEYFHPFEANLPGGRLDISSNWILSETASQTRYDQAVCISPHLLEQNLGPKSKNCRQYNGVVPYGYHIDAVLMGKFLRKKAVERGVEHIQATVEMVKLDHGQVSFIDTDKGRFEADFFIDCTGFKGVLINELKQDNWRSFEKELPCNRAVAIQTPYPTGATAKPYTVATALDFGWAWQIGLENREGTGYVYDGNLLTQEQAETELRKFLGPQAQQREARHLKMKVGCLQQQWVGNCAAVGLSAGFIEPLESTGLHLINMAVRQLGTHLVGNFDSDVIRRSFNTSMLGIYDDLKQFIVLHYCLTDRDDTPFWQRAQTTASECVGLESKLAIWKHKICEYLDLAGGFTTSFNDENYRYVLYGMQHYPNLSNSLLDSETDVLERAQNIIEATKGTLLNHEEYIASLRALR